MIQNHHQFMRHALVEAEKALMAKEFPVGCVLVYDGDIVVSGQRSHSATGEVNELDHAEITALRSLVEEYPQLQRDKVVVYSTMEPCLMCYSTLILNGIRNMVFGFEDVMGGGTNLNLAQLNPLYREMTVTVVPHILREECLLLFKKFFTDQDNRYWRDSRLAEYVLAQPERKR